MNSRQLKRSFLYPDDNDKSGCTFFTFQNYGEPLLYRIGLPSNTVKILKIGTPEIITIIVLQLEQLDFTVQYCVQKMPTE